LISIAAPRYLTKEHQLRVPDVLVTVAALNLAKADLLQQPSSEGPASFSIASYKRLALNEHLLERFISMLALAPTLIKSLPTYDAMRSYGLIAP
jgi:hypothetical protein